MSFGRFGIVERVVSVVSLGVFWRIVSILSIGNAGSNGSVMSFGSISNSEHLVVNRVHKQYPKKNFSLR